MDSYDNFDLIGDENLMQDAFNFGDLDPDPGCCFPTRERDWDPFSASGSGTRASTASDASIWSEELLNSIVGAEMVMGGDALDQVGPAEGQSGSFKSLMVIGGDMNIMLSEGESQVGPTLCSSEGNSQMHEIEGKVRPIVYNFENLEGAIVTKEELVIEASDADADSGSALHDPGPLGDYSPEAELVIDKLVGSGLMEKSKTQEAENFTLEEDPTECNSENSRGEMVIGGRSTPDERECHVGPTGSDSVNLGAEMVVAGRNKQSSDGECHVGPTCETSEGLIVTEGERNVQSDERESHAGVTVGDSENLVDEMLAEVDMHDQAGERDGQVGCNNLIEGDAEMVTTGDINNQSEERSFQAGPTKLVRPENEPNAFKECIGISKNTPLFQESVGKVHEVPQKEKEAESNTEEDATTAVSHSEKHVAEIGQCEVHKSVDEKNGAELPLMESSGEGERVKSELRGRELSIPPAFSLCESSVVEVDSGCALLDPVMRPASPSCKNLIEGDTEMVTTGDINNQPDERGFQAGPTNLVRSENESNACIGNSKSNPLFQESIGEVHEVPQEEKEAADLKSSLAMGGESNTEEQTTTAVSHSEKHVAQVGPCEVHKSADEKNGAELPLMETGVEVERVKSELRGRELSIPPAFSLCEASVVEVDCGCALLDLGPLSNSSPETHLTIDKPVPDPPPRTPIILAHSLGNKLVAPLCVETAAFPDSSSTEANMGDHHPMENNTKNEVEKITTEENGSADCSQASVEEDPIELIEEPTVEAASAEKRDENGEALNENVLIHSNGEIENTTEYKNLESSLCQNIQEGGTSRFPATTLACEKPTVVEALPESPAGMGNTKELHHPSDDVTNMSDLQAVRPIQVNQVESDSMEKSIKEIPVTYENSISVREMPSSVTEGGTSRFPATTLACENPTVVEALPESPAGMGNTKELHHPSDDVTNMSELQAVQPIRVNQVESDSMENSIKEIPVTYENSISVREMPSSVTEGGTSRFPATTLACENPTVVEALPESPAGMGNTKELHHPSDDVTNMSELQAVQPIRVNQVESDSMEKSIKEIPVTYENSISVCEMPSPVTEIVCKSDLLSEVIKETAVVAETVPDTELHGPKDGMGEPMDISPAAQSIEVKAVEPLDRTIDEVTKVDNIPQNSIINDVTMEDVTMEDAGPEPSPVKMLSGSHGDVTSDDDTQEIDNDKISVDRMQKKGDEETNHKDTSGKAGIIDDATMEDVGPTLFPVKISSERHVDAGPVDSTPVQLDAFEQEAEDGTLSVNPLMEKITEETEDVGPTLFPVKISSEHHVDAGPVDSTPVRLDAPEQEAEDGTLSVNPSMEKITEENNAENAADELDTNAAIDDMKPRSSPVKISSEVNMDTSLIDGAPIQPEDKMEDGNFSVNPLMEKITEEMEDVGPTLFPVKIGSECHVDAGHVDSTPVQFDALEQEAEDGTLSVNPLMEKITEEMEDVGPTLFPVKISSERHVDAVPVDSTPVQLDALEQEAEDGTLSVNPLMEKITEANNAENAPDELDTSAAIDDMKVRFSPVKISSEFNVDTSLIDGAPIQLEDKMDDSKISGDPVSEKSTEQTYKNTPMTEDGELSFSPVKMSSEFNVGTSLIDGAPIQPEDKMEDGKFSGDPVSEKSTEQTYENTPTTEDGELTFSPVKISSEFNVGTSLIDGAPIQPEDKMEDGNFSGDPVSENSTEQTYENTPTTEDGELSFSPVKITPAPDMDVGTIDHIQPEDETKNVKISEKCGDEYMKKGIEKCEVTIEEASKEDMGQQLSPSKDSSGAHTDIAPVNSDLMPSETEIKDGSEYKNGNSQVHVGTSKEAVNQIPPTMNQCGAHLEVTTCNCVTIQPHYETVDREYLGEAIQRSETVVCSPQVESLRKEPQSGAGVNQADFVPSIQPDDVMDDGKRTGDLDVVQSNGLGEYLGDVNRGSQALVSSLVEEMRPECESTPLEKECRAHKEINSTVEGEDVADTNQSDTMVISSGEEMGTQSKLSHQELVAPIEAETKIGDVTDASLGEYLGEVNRGSQALVSSLAEEMRPECELTPLKKEGGAHKEINSTVEGDDVGDTNQSDTMVISLGEEMGTQSKLSHKELVAPIDAETKIGEVTGASLGEYLGDVNRGSQALVSSLVEEMRPECESTPLKKEGGAHKEINSTVEGDDVADTNRSDTMVISLGEEMGTQSKLSHKELVAPIEAETKIGEVTGASLGEYLGDVNRGSQALVSSLVEEMRPECESTPLKKEGRAHKEINSTVEGDDVGDTNQSDTMVISLGEEMGTQIKLSHQELVAPIEAETTIGEVTGASLENANASSAVKLSQNSHIGDALTPQLDNFLKCTSTESNDPTPNLPEFESGKMGCSEPTCSLSHNIEVGAMEQRQVKLIVPENETREKNSLKSPPSASETVVDDKTQDLKKGNGVSSSKIHSPITSEAVMSDEAVNNGTYVEKNVKLPDLNVPHSATALSPESLTEAQQMQLRAQIFVYGSLVEGSLPMEAYMARSFGESERCVWEPIWRAYSETLKNRSPPYSGETPTLSGRSPALSSISQSSRWLFSPEIQARNEPPQPIRVSFESEKPRKRKSRNANPIAAAIDNVKPDFTVQIVRAPVSPVLAYARHSKKEKTGVEIVQLKPTSEVLTDKVVPGGSLEKGPNVEPIFSLDRERSILSDAALPICQQQCVSTEPQYEVATATAVAAAEFVANAAAAAKLASEAARLASEAALQAKLLADDAMGLMGPNPGPEQDTLQKGLELEMVTLTPAKVLKGKDKVHGSHAVVSAMREASRRRVKLATAASKRAENVDNILSAAEQAAEAVSRAGQVVMMGDPLPFSIADMVEAIGGVHLRAVQSREADVSRRGELVDMGVATREGAEAAQVGPVSTSDTVPLSLCESELTGMGEDTLVGNGGNVIRKGSHVEVREEKEGLIGVWFGAIVLDLKDGMAHIRYTDLPLCKEEWVPLERESAEAPMIRLAHPVTSLTSDGNRKRRRENVSSYSWSVGDHVDAWMRHGWWEGIVTQKHADEAKFTVRFLAQGDSLVVGEWDLRPSLVWKEGSWVEWVRVKESSQFDKGDSPLEKRRRVNSTPHETETVMPKPNLSRSTKIPRPLNQYIGANRKREENESEPKRTGPRVCFGVPRPNKKTKFLEVAQVSRPISANDTVPVPISNGREKQQRPLTRIPKPSKAPLSSSSRVKRLEEGTSTKVRGNKAVTEPIFTSKRTFSSTIPRGGQGGSKKGVLNVGSETLNRAGKTEVADAGPTEPRSARKIKPTKKLLEGLETNSLMSKIPGVGSAKGSASLRGSTRQ